MNKEESSWIDVHPPPLMNSEFFMHYGVKGMKWGVRKDKGYRYTNRDGDIVLKKGSNIHRITSNPKEKSGYAYASFTKKDVNHYRSSVTSWITSASRSSDTVCFDMTMKATKDLVAPSELKKINTFLDLYKDKSVQDEIYRMAENVIFMDDQKHFRFLRLSENITKLGLPENTAEVYAAFSMGLNNSSKLRNEFFSRLETQGYDMVLDTEDAFLEAEAPVIIFNRDNSLKTLRVSSLPRKWSSEWKETQRQDLSNRKEEYGLPLTFGDKFKID